MSPRGARRPPSLKLVVSVRVLDGKGGRVLGEGIVALLEGIAASGSIAEAARGMGMAYSKAWRIIRTLETALGRPALARAKGGRARGGATLTPVARDLLRRYRTLAAGMRASLAARPAADLLRIFR